MGHLCPSLRFAVHNFKICDIQNSVLEVRNFDQLLASYCFFYIVVMSHKLNDRQFFEVLVGLSCKKFSSIVETVILEPFQGQAPRPPFPHTTTMEEHIATRLLSHWCR